jgi:antitoxin component of MazEF toxin-antitoxin module
MAKKLTRTGNSLALVLEKPILEATGIDDETPLEVSTDGDVIIVSPVRSKRRTAKLKKILDELHREHAGAFRRLAEWSSLSGAAPVTFLTLDEVLAIHADQIERYGGALGIRDRGLLESALAMPEAAFSGTELHPTLHEKAAAYLFHLVKTPLRGW